MTRARCIGGSQRGEARRLLLYVKGMTQIRHGWKGLLWEGHSCPTSQISKEAGAGKLVKRQGLLPDKPKHNEGRSRKQVVRDTSRPADPRRDPTKILNNNSNNKEIKTLPLRKNPNNQREFCNYYEIKDLHLCRIIAIIKIV